jgi:monovalent cation:H+ antiporter-2, CPA2 family
MGHVPLLPELVVIVLVGVAASLLLSKLRLPSAAGLLLAGAVVGPFGLGLVKESKAIEVLAEVGVVLLLFTIGLEFSLERFVRIARLVVFGGSLQVFLTSAMAFGLARLMEFSVAQAIFFGFVFALSSTAIVLRGLADRGETDAPHGRFIVGVLIFQDLCVVPMVLIIPILAGTTGEGVALPLAIALGKAVAVVLGTLVVARVVVPRFFGLVDAAGSREVFLLAVLGICIGTAWLTSLAGLSLALGAFLGGMVVAGTQFGHRAMGEILPLRDVFTAVFFVSMGMLFDAHVAVSEPLSVVGLTLAFVLGKAVLATIAALAMRFPARAAVIAGFGLAQFGEFGFVLVQVADRAGVVETGDIQPLLAAGIISMFLTPVLMQVSPHITAGELLLRPLERLLGARGVDEVKEHESALCDHVIVVGYGVAGRLVSQALRRSGIPYVILELNSETVRKASSDGEHIYYGDISSAEALLHAGVKEARAVVVLINDPTAARRGLETLKRAAPEVPVLMRTRYLGEQHGLEGLVSDLVYEEVEAGVEMLARVLKRFSIPRREIMDCLEEARENTQRSARASLVPRTLLSEMRELDELEIEKVILIGSHTAIGRTPVELDVRKKTGALIVAIRRNGSLTDSLDPHSPFFANDVVYLVGSPQSVTSASELLRRGAGLNSESP